MSPCIDKKNHGNHFVAVLKCGQLSEISERVLKKVAHGERLIHTHTQAHKHTNTLIHSEAISQSLF